MNELNYTSLEVSKKLVENSIVLETDFYWATYGEKACRSLRDAGKLVPKPYLVSSQSLPAVIIKNPTNSGYYPAASSAELWRELPNRWNGMGLLEITKHYTKDISICGYYSYENEDWLSESFASINPADALAELLMFVRREKSNAS